MSAALVRHLHTAFAPPQYLAPPLAGVDVSASGVKAVRLRETAHGLVLDRYADIPLPPSAFLNGELSDRAAVKKALIEACTTTGIHTATVSLPEAKSYLFETTVSGETKAEWRLQIEQHLEELVPLPPPMTAFDVTPVGQAPNHDTRVLGIGFARAVVEGIIEVCDEAELEARALESENFAMARALLPKHDESTALIIDIGKTTTKLSIVSRCLPRFATTIAVGGHALTIAIQKNFGVTEEEARKIKSEQGILPVPGKEEFLGTMLSTISAIRDEVVTRLEYWQAKAAPGSAHEPVTHAIIAGGNATIRGLQEYMESALNLPVMTGNVFTNFASTEAWLPQINYNESLAFATALGLALREPCSV
jgi:type IV pilus assembly protein PilM